MFYRELKGTVEEFNETKGNYFLGQMNGQCNEKCPSKIGATFKEKCMNNETTKCLRK